MLLVVQAVLNGESRALRTDWIGFQRHVGQHALSDRAAQITLTTGETIKAVFLRTEDSGLVVRANRKTRQWKTKEGEALVPRALVSGVKFTGKMGHGGLIGGLAGLGAGAGVAAAAAKSVGEGNCEGGSCGAVVLVVPLLAIAGYFIGRSTSKPAPSFVIEH
jgi:hypothetical protein